VGAARHFSPTPANPVTTPPSKKSSVGVPARPPACHSLFYRAKNFGEPDREHQPASVRFNQHMAPTDNGSRSDPISAETTAALPDDHLDELHEPTSHSAEEAVPGLELPTDSALLLVQRGPNAGARFLLNRDFMTAGRHPDSDIFLNDITVSRRHAEFRRENGKFRIVDAGSLNGTYINRQPVDSAVLANHDKIQIGKFRLVFFTAP
jgi:pSer/pThr/pTyr-binding forkhead associated (FHA) protein